MIVYFSATGNTRFVAEELARLLDDEALDLSPRIRAGDFSDIHSDTPLLVCSPIHVSGLPKFYADYLKKVAFTGSADVYGVFTNAGYSGIAGAQLKAICRKKGMRFKGFSEFKFPGIHITSITHKPISDEEVEKRIRTSSERVPSVARVMQRGADFENKHAWLAEVALTAALAPFLRFVGMRTKGFWATEQCIACGKCEKICPVAAIQMRSGKPSWIPSHCAHCMACVHNCPVEAIEYGKRTQGKRRYTLSKFRYAIVSSPKTD